MSPVSVAVLAVSLSADAFAAALGQGARRRPTWPQALRRGLVFGVIEGLTPVVGWALGLAAAAWVTEIDHWIAFVLLSLVGGRMVLEAVRSWNEAQSPDDGSGTSRKGWGSIIMTAVGTSIDAAVVGVTLAFIGADILLIALATGLTTFLFATGGLMAGKAAGLRLGRGVELLGGLLLIGLGTRILLEHLGYIA